MNITCTRDGHAPFRNLIYDQGGTLRVQVIDMQLDMFRPSAGEVHFFGDNFGDILAFETIGYHGQNENEIKAMIRWYANWIGYPQMQIYNQNPLI